MHRGPDGARDVRQVPFGLLQRQRQVADAAVVGRRRRRRRRTRRRRFASHRSAVARHRTCSVGIVSISNFIRKSSNFFGQFSFQFFPLISNFMSIFTDTTLFFPLEQPLFRFVTRKLQVSSIFNPPSSPFFRVFSRFFNLLFRFLQLHLF